MWSDNAPALRVAGDTVTYHTYSHQEGLSTPQEHCHFFSLQTATQLAEFIKLLDSFKEGDGTLLDQTLLVALVVGEEAEEERRRRLEPLRLPEVTGTEG